MTKNEKVNEAFELFIQGLSPQEIAEKLNMSVNTVKTWKRRYSWDTARGQPVQKEQITSDTVTARSKRRRRGAPPGNQNSVGHKSSVPLGNQNARKHGLFCKKFFPKETQEIIQEAMDASPLDLLWNQILIQYAAIVRSQQLMYVVDRHDMTTTQIGEKNGDTVHEERWEVQQAWDKHANYMKSLSVAQNALKSLIKQYETMLHANWDLATEEQKTRIQAIKAKAQLNDKEETEDDGFIEALNSSAVEDWKDEEADI